LPLHGSSPRVLQRPSFAIKELRLEPVEERNKVAIDDFISTKRYPKYEISCGLFADDINKSGHVIRMHNHILPRIPCL
jgi:hypothetical protein